MAESAQQPAQRYRRPIPGGSFTGGVQVSIPGANRPYAQLSDFIGQAGSAMQAMRQLDLELEKAKIEEKVAIGMVTPASDDPLKDNLLYKARFREVAADRLGKEAARTLESAAPAMITEAMKGYIFGGEHSPVEVFKESLDAWQEDYAGTVLGEQNVSEFGVHPAYLNQLDAAKTRAYGLLNNSVQSETVSQLMTTARGKIRDSLDSVRNADQDLSPNFLRKLRDDFKDYPLKLRGENSIETLIHQEVVAGALNTLQDPATEAPAWIRAYQELAVLDQKGFAKNDMSLNAIVQGKKPSPKPSVLTTATNLLHQRLKGANSELKTETIQKQQNWMREYYALTREERSKLLRTDVTKNAPFAQLATALKLHEEATSTGSAMLAAMQFKHNAFLKYPTEPELDVFLASKPEWKDYHDEIKGQWADHKKADEAQEKAKTLTATQYANFRATTDSMLLDQRHDFIGDLEKRGPDGNPGINRAQVLSLRLKESVLLKTAAEGLDTAQGKAMTAVLNTPEFGSLKAADLEKLLSKHKIDKENKGVIRAYQKAEKARLKELATATKQTAKEAALATTQAEGRIALTTAAGLERLFDPISGGNQYIGELTITNKWDADDVTWAKAFFVNSQKVEADAESQKQYKLFLSLVQRKDLDKIEIAEFYEKTQFLKGPEQTLLAKMRLDQGITRNKLSKEAASATRRNNGVSGLTYQDFASDRARETILDRVSVFDLDQVDEDYLMAKMDRIKSIELGYAEDKEFEVFKLFVNRTDLASVTTAQIEDELQDITNSELRSAARREWQEQRALKLANAEAEKTEERRVDALRAYGRLSDSKNEEDLLALDFGELKEDHPLFAPEGDQYRDTLIKLKRRIEGQRAESTVRMEQRRADERVRTLSQDTVISRRILSNIELSDKWALENGINSNTLKLLRERQTEVRAVADEAAVVISEGKGSLAELLRLFALSDEEILEQNISENTLLVGEDAVAAARLQEAAQRRAEGGVARTGAEIVASLSNNTSISRSLLLQIELTPQWAKENNVTPKQRKILTARKAVVKKEEADAKKEVGKADASATELMRIWNLGDAELIVLDIAEETLLNKADKKKAKSLQDKALGRERDQKIIKEKSLRLFWKKKYEGDIGLLLETSDAELTTNLGTDTGGLADVLILKAKEKARREGLGPEQTADSLMFEFLASDLTGWTAQQIQELMPISGEGGLRSNEGRREKLLEEWLKQKGEKVSEAAKLKAEQSVYAVQRTTNDYYRRISLIRVNSELDFTAQITQIQTIQAEAIGTLAEEKQFVALDKHADAEVKKLEDLRDSEPPTYTQEWRPLVNTLFNEIVKYPFDDLLQYKDPNTPTEDMLIERYQVLILKGKDLTEAHRVAKEIFDENKDFDLDDVSAKMTPYLQEVRKKVEASLPTWFGSATVKNVKPSHVIDQEKVEEVLESTRDNSTERYIHPDGQSLPTEAAESIYLLKQINK